MQGTEAFLLATAGLAAGVFFFARARQAQSALKQQREVALKSNQQLEEVRAARESDAKRISSHAVEVADLRKRLDKAKRRVAQAAPKNVAVGSASVITELESQLEEARRLRDDSRQEAEALSRELSRVRQASSVSAVKVETPVVEDAQLEGLRNQLEEARAALTRAKKELEASEKTRLKLKRKMDTQELLYVSIRSELDAKKDRLRTQQEELERLMALKAVVLGASDAAGGDVSDESDSSLESEVP
jgi:uncharacterized membrane-anchored protein YhcB (DUF1043 family)